MQQTANSTLSHPDKILYPDLGVTKRELLDYYSVVAPLLLPHVIGRPLTLVRCPDGYQESCFFQKHPNENLPNGLRRVALHEKRGKASYSVIDDVSGLFALVQMGVLEIHTWGAHVENSEKPDLLVFDIDPDVNLPFQAVIECAHHVRKLLNQLNLSTFVKTTGGKGLHVCLPVQPDLNWEEAKAFCKRVALEIVKIDPDRYIAVASKTKREGKIFIDYLRNARGATFVAPYSTRARSGAPIATPIEWDELTARFSPLKFSLRSFTRRLAKLNRDPSAKLFAAPQRLPPKSLI